jgi:hypothetical protein
MTEREYIDATNLAKVRAAKVIAHDLLPMSPEDEADQVAALSALRRIEARLEHRMADAPPSLG